MHGLIFKTKESHRQDQSESFVIYMGERESEKHAQEVCACFFFFLIFSSSFHNESNEIASLWPVFCKDIYDVERHTYIYSLFHRDETKPTHIIGINSFLFFMQLIYKHSSPNYQHMINSCKLINKMLVSLRWCAYVETFSTAFTSLPVVMSFFYLRNSFVFHVTFRYMTSVKQLTKQLRQTFSLITYHSFHTANRL